MQSLKNLNLNQPIKLKIWHLFEIILRKISTDFCHVLRLKLNLHQQKSPPVPSPDRNKSSSALKPWQIAILKATNREPQAEDLLINRNRICHFFVLQSTAIDPHKESSGDEAMAVSAVIVHFISSEETPTQTHEEIVCGYTVENVQILVDLPLISCRWVIGRLLDLWPNSTSLLDKTYDHANNYLLSATC